MLFSSITRNSLWAATASVVMTPSHHLSRRGMASLAHQRYMKRKALPIMATTAASSLSMPSSKNSSWSTPSLASVENMPKSVRGMDNSTLITLAALLDHDACQEMLIRHIMQVDRVDYHKAIETFKVIHSFHQAGLFGLLWPYKIGIVTAVTAGFSSIPLCFHLPTVEWFNQHFVTTDVPEPADLETFLEVGSWAWNWMEPPLGQISFFLLCLQFSRAQLENLGIRPYTRQIKQYRVQRLQEKFPMYDARILAQYSKTCRLMQ